MKYVLTVVVFGFFPFLNFAQKTAVQVDSKAGFDHQTDSILIVAIQLLDSVVNSESFAQKINAAAFTRNRGFSNKEILKLFRSGKENQIADNVMNLKLEVYLNDAGGGEVGQTTGDDVTHTYQGYILKNGAACYAAHLAHEYCHVLGFTHPKFHFLGHKKAHSVPYLIGYFVANILGVDCP